MLMIPITYLPATALVGIAIWLATSMYQRVKAPWLIAFLCVLGFQLFLLGARYGYGMDAVLNIQHLSGVLIPPLGYLAFTNPKLTPRLWVHGLPVIAMVLTLFVAIDFVDAALALITLGYAGGLLACLQRNGDDTFSWAPLRYAMTLRFGLIATAAALILSGVTDAAVAADFMTNGGLQIVGIVKAASIGGVLLSAICAMSFLRYGGGRPQPQATDTDDALVQKLTAEITGKKHYQDPDLTLSRLAKRLGLPARDISQAVNRSTGLNMSQFINNIRISAVCEILSATNVPITTAMLEAGFYTKSNFNREFRRVMGQTPTQWRSAKQ